MIEIVRRPIEWVQAQIARLNAEQAAVEAEYKRKHEAALAAALEAQRPKPRPPQAPAVVTARDRERRVLITGINRYGNGGANDLRGCVTDANRWRDLFVAGGWKPIMLLDEDAAADSILDCLHMLATRAEPGDAIAWVNSSHGTTLPDFSDPTGQVEAVCPADSLGGTSEQFRQACITHREIYEALSIAADGVEITVLSDSCHSGVPAASLDALVGARALVANSPPPDYRRARYLAPPPGLEVAGARSARLASLDRGLVAVNSIRAVILAGCGTEQTSADAYIGGSYCGAFSYYMQQAYKLQPTLPLGALLLEAERQLAAAGYEQRPEAEGPETRLRQPAPWAPRA